MGIIKKMRKGYAAYWARTGFDDFGQPTYAAPIEIRVRWEDVNEVFVKSNGTTFTSRSIVYVDRSVTQYGYLWRGRLTDAPSDPVADEHAHLIQETLELPDLRYRNVLYRAIL